MEEINIEYNLCVYQGVQPP